MEIKRPVLLSFSILYFIFGKTVSEKSHKPHAPSQHHIKYRKFDLLSDSDKNCVCFDQDPDAPTISYELDPQNNGLKRLVVYFYLNYATGVLSMYIPNLKNQMVFPDLIHDDGDILETVSNEYLAKMVKTNPNIISINHPVDTNKQNNVKQEVKGTSQAAHPSSALSSRIRPDGPDIGPGIRPGIGPGKRPSARPGLGIIPGSKSNAPCPNHNNGSPCQRNNCPHRQTSYVSPQQQNQYQISHQQGNYQLPHQQDNYQLPHQQDKFPFSDQHEKSSLPNQQGMYTKPHQQDKYPTYQQQTQPQRLINYNSSNINQNSSDLNNIPGNGHIEPHSQDSSSIIPRPDQNREPLKSKNTVTLNQWIFEQIKHMEQDHTIKSDPIDTSTLEKLIQNILSNHGIVLSVSGILTDSSGKVLDMTNLHLRPVLIGDSMQYDKIISKLNGSFNLPSDLPYLESLIVTLSNPSKVLGIIPLNKVYIPKGLKKAYASSLNAESRNFPVDSKQSNINNPGLAASNSASGAAGVNYLPPVNLSYQSWKQGVGSNNIQGSGNGAKTSSFTKIPELHHETTKMIVKNSRLKHVSRIPYFGPEYQGDQDNGQHQTITYSSGPEEGENSLIELANLFKELANYRSDARRKNGMPAVPSVGAVKYLNKKPSANSKIPAIPEVNFRRAENTEDSIDPINNDEKQGKEEWKILNLPILPPVPQDHPLRPTHVFRKKANESEKPASSSKDSHSVNGKGNFGIERLLQLLSLVTRNKSKGPQGILGEVEKIEEPGFRIIGGAAATGSGFPISNRG